MRRIKLTEKEYLSAFVKSGRKSARELTRAHVLLLVNWGKIETEIKDTLGIGRQPFPASKRGTVKKVFKAL